MTTELVNVIDNSIEIIQNGGIVLQKNKERSAKALTIGNDIMDAISKNGMSAELDIRANNFLANCRKAKEEMNEARKPVTQILDTIKSEFTASENALDVTKADSIPFKLQQHRNAWVKKLKEEEEKKQREAEAKANVDREKIELKAQLETAISNHLNDALLQKKTSINSAFNNITLENFEDKSNGLKAMEVNYPTGLLNNFAPVIKAKFLSAEDARNLTEEVFTKYRNTESTSQFATQWVNEITQLKNELVDKLPSKKSELETLKKASADEKLLLEKKAAERKEAEDKRMQEEAEKKKLEAQQKIDLEKVADETQVLFDKEAATIMDGPEPETRSGYNIEVKHPIGYTQIFTLWFEKEGKNLPIDKIGNTKLDQMKKWCEKFAHKTGEKIESAYLVYNDEIKAVNKKVK